MMSEPGNDGDRRMCLRCRKWAVGEHLCQTIEDGHRYHVSVVEQGNEADDIEGGCVDSDEVGAEKSLSVRAWSLEEAMDTAGKQREGLWDRQEEEDR